MSATVDISAARQRLASAYDPLRYQRSAGAVVDLLADYLVKAQASAGCVLNWRAPKENADEAGEAMRRRDADVAVGRADVETLDRFVSRVRDLATLALSRGQTLHDPRYVGHQVPPPLPIAAVFEAISSATNQAMAIYEMGPWASGVEETLVRELGEAIGFPRGTFTGFITSGGSLANLTALLTARNVALGDVWRTGLAGRAGPAPVIVAHAEAHYSIARAAGVLGIGSQQVVKAALDAKQRIHASTLDAQLRNLRGRGHPIIAVAAAACSTRTGSFDALDAVADVCRDHQVWLHVDAAHGGAACLSERHRHLVAGLNRADSVIWDAHKMLHVPALSTFVFYRDAAHRFSAFEQDAPYLFDPARPGLAEFDSGLKTIECTKRAAGFGLWAVWSLFGRQLFADIVDVTFETTRRFHDMLRAEPDFQPLHEPQCNILVFRHIPSAMREASAENLGAFQLELRRRVIESGAFYLVPGKDDGVGALRVVITNPLTTETHLSALIRTLREEGSRLLAPLPSPTPAQGPG